MSPGRTCMSDSSDRAAAWEWPGEVVRCDIRGQHIQIWQLRKMHWK